MNRIREINILGKRYKVSYFEKPSDVDIFKRKSLWGQIDYWTSEIRVYVGYRTEDEIWETILHEVIHGLVNELNIRALKNSDDSHNEEAVGLLSVGLYDTLYRNGMLKDGGDDL